MGLRENLRKPAAVELDVRAADVAGVDTTVGEAIALMQDLKIGCLVVTEHGRPIGIFTERDVLTRVIAKSTPYSTRLGEVMTRDPVTIDERSSVADVVHCMHQGGLRHVPFVDASDRLRGIISVKRIVEHLVEHVPRAVFNLPPDPTQKQVAREGA